MKKIMFFIFLFVSLFASAQHGQPNINNTDFKGNNYFEGVDTLAHKTTITDTLSFKFGLDATGDMYYRNASGIIKRLGIGTAGQIMTVSAGLPSWGAAGGAGTVTNVSVGNLSPIFTTVVSNPTTTPSVAFTLTNAPAHTFLGDSTGSAGAPAYVHVSVSDILGLGSMARADSVTYHGNTNISTLGTVTTGVWSATSIDTAKTNAVSNVTAGVDILVATAGKTKIVSADTTAGYTKLATQGYVLRNVPASVNIYNSDGTLTGNRAVDVNGNSLDFNNIGALNFNAPGAGITFGASSFLINDGFGGANLAYPNAPTSQYDVPILNNLNTLILGRLDTNSFNFSFYDLVNNVVASGDTSYWALSAGNIYNKNAGFVGIGTSSPAALLDVEGVHVGLSVDDGTNQARINDVTGSTGGALFDYAGLTTIGDAFGGGNATAIAIDDGNQTIVQNCGGTQIAQDGIVGTTTINFGLTIDANGMIVQYGGSPASNGQVFVGKASDGTFRATTLTEGAGIAITNGSASITIATKDGTINYDTPTTGSTVTGIVGSNIYEPAGALLALTVNLPATPSNGDISHYTFTQPITTLTFSGGTVVNTITTAAAGGTVAFQFYSGTNKWYKWQ